MKCEVCEAKCEGCKGELELDIESPLMQLILPPKRVLAIYIDDEKDDIFTEKVDFVGLDESGRSHFLILDETGTAMRVYDDSNFLRFWFSETDPKKEDVQSTINTHKGIMGH